uniref:Uncharacterized protein n=1 Tax=Rhizophora mucronata TaxID=61149 RepID=A0A2P2NPE5_RHIMU
MPMLRLHQHWRISLFQLLQHWDLT